MTARLVADVGNTRIKWGVCGADGLTAASAVPPDDPAAWAAQLHRWGLSSSLTWAIAGVHPARRDRLADWLRGRGYEVRVLSDYRELPLRVDVAVPEKVGIDRLLNAVAAADRVPPQTPAVIIDAGSAVTVDLVDDCGVFRGGAIFPGLHLMARALHDYTAALPLVENIDVPAPPLPGRDTVAAITAGVVYAVGGGIDRLVERLTASATGARVFFSGGSSDLLAQLTCRPEPAGPYLALDGVRRTVWPAL
jgi:type III pantothenate kinase